MKMIDAAVVPAKIGDGLVAPAKIRAFTKEEWATAWEVSPDYPKRGVS